MKTLTHTQTQNLINENYKLRQENEMAREGIKIHSDKVVIKVLANSIKKNEVIINANNFIMSEYVTVLQYTK